MKITKRVKNSEVDGMEIENFWYNGSAKNFTKISISFFFSKLFRKFPFNLHADGDDNSRKKYE